MEEASVVCPDISVLRRVLLAAGQVPRDIPSFWDLVTSFGFKKATEKPTTEKVRVLVQNTQLLDYETLILDEELFRELVQHEGFDGHPLVSSNSICKDCGGNLLVRADRPSFLMGYTFLEQFQLHIFENTATKPGQGAPSLSTMGFIPFVRMSSMTKTGQISLTTKQNSF